MLPDWVTLTTDRADEPWWATATVLIALILLGVAALTTLVMLGASVDWLLISAPEDLSETILLRPHLIT